jgi:glycosyltransferase involved in cell wall biosynthesis
MISIIIPFHNQTEEELAIPLSSINNQVGIDFSKIDVHLINDAGPKIDIRRFNVFSHLNIKYHELSKNSGPGVARQYGIEHSGGDYLMFIDSDDMLYLPIAINYFFLALKKSTNPQLIVSSIINQKDLSTNYETQLPGTGYSQAAVYGKLFSRSYLKKINLSFHPELRVFEDTYFSGLAWELATEILTFNEATYLHLFNESSISQSKNGGMTEYSYIYVLVKRLQLEKFIQEKVDNFQLRLENAILSIYIFSKRIPPLYPHKYLFEVKKLFREFPYDFKTNESKMKIFIDSQQGLNPDLKIDWKDFQKFIADTKQ